MEWYCRDPGFADVASSSVLFRSASVDMLSIACLTPVWSKRKRKNNWDGGEGRGLTWLLHAAVIKFLVPKDEIMLGSRTIEQ